MSPTNEYDPAIRAAIERHHAMRAAVSETVGAMATLRANVPLAYNEVSNVNMRRKEPLITPIEVIDRYPLSEHAKEAVKNSRHQIERVISNPNKNSKLIVAVGPCSIFDKESAVEYARYVAIWRAIYGDYFEIVMRTYFEKPRTIMGWKGLIPDPNRDNSHDKNKGLVLAREILCEINDLGVPATSELLNPTTPQYIDDLLAVGSIGARNVESQPSRELASGVSFGMGFKNGTRGGIDVAVEGMKAASHPHHLDGIDEFGMPAQFETEGNQHTFMILRGSKKGPNYYEPYVHEAITKMLEHGFTPRLMVDCSHKNKDKITESQMPALEETARQIAEGNTSIIGAMIESNLVEGRQGIDAENLVYGQSVTDACEGLERTESMLEKLAKAQVARRNS